MSPERKKGFTISASLHALFLLAVIVGLPELLSPKPPVEPTAISVEILPVTGVTNIKPSETPPAEEEKPEPKKQEAKHAPPVKTSEPKPEPKPEAVPLPKKEDQKKKEEKKPEPKKEEKKKPKEDPLAAILKAVKDTAQQQKKTDKKTEPKDDSSKSKSTSQSYNPNLPLSMSEQDAIRSQIAKCWNVPAGAKNAHELAVTLSLQLDRDGSVLKVELASKSKDRYNSDSFFRTAADSAIRAVRQCSPLKDLPPEKYDTWRDIEMTFDPKDMLF